MILFTNTVIRIEFSKEMNQDSFVQSFSLLPSTDFEIEWSNYWEDAGKAVSIHFPELLAFNTEYILDLSGELTDVIGIYLDGNTDGVSGDGISITFHTEPTDLTAPQITSIYPIINYIFDTEAVFNIMFDEVLNINNIDETSLQIESGGQNLTIDYVEHTLDEKTTLSLKLFSPLLNNSNCIISIYNLSDTLGNTISQPLHSNTIQLIFIIIINIFWIDSTLGQDGGNPMEVAPQLVLSEAKHYITIVTLYLSRVFR